METERASSVSSVPTAPALMAPLLSHLPLPAASHPSMKPHTRGCGLAQPPLITPPFPSLETPIWDVPEGHYTPSQTQVNAGSLT